MASLLETIMLICFAVSWPFNIAKAWKGRTAKGISPIFLTCVIIGYLAGIAAKYVSGNFNYVVIVYVFNTLLVFVNLLIYFRNLALDKKAEIQAKKA